MATKKWKPEQDEIYWSVILWDIPQVRDYTWVDDYVDIGLYKSGNCYKTKTEANKKLKLIKAILKQP